jgi:uncharacterized membrane protein
MKEKFLFAMQAAGAVLFATVCVAFIFGLRATTSNVVLHGETAFRIVLGASGSIFLVLVAVGLVVAYRMKTKTTMAPA